MTDYFKAYAHRVAAYLPSGQRDELFAEIYDDLCEEYADWQADHPGSDPLAFLQDERPHPMKFAAQLASGSSAYLVGPAFYFSFITALKTSLAIVVGLHIVLAVISILAGGSVPTAVFGMLTGLPGTMLWVGACVLGVFVAMERSGEKASWLERWDASKLEPADSHQEISRLETSFDLGLATLALLWLLDVVRIPPVVRHDGIWATDWSVNLPDFAWLAIGALLAWDIFFAIIRLGRSLWTRRLRLLTIAGNLLWLVLLAYVLTRPELLTLQHDAADRFLPLVENALRGGLLVLCGIIAWDTATHAWRLVRSGS